MHTRATSSIFTGGGVAAFDCDDDGLDELYFAGGSGRRRAVSQRQQGRWLAPFQRDSRPGHRSCGGHGRIPAGYRRGWATDLVVLRNGENVLLRGLGGCRFERANEAWSSTVETP